LTKPVKKASYRRHSHEELQGANHANESAAPSQGDRGQPLQARRADHAIVVLRDAFPAEKLTTLRAPRRRFAASVVEATLMSQVAHGPNLHGLRKKMREKELPPGRDGFRVPGSGFKIRET